MDPKILYTIVGIIIAGVFAGLVKLIPVVIKAVRSNSNPGKDTLLKSVECKPGKAQICIDRGTTLTEHTETIKHLIKETEESKGDRKEIKGDIKKILFKMGIGD